jgi:hypothetical protein
MVGQGGRYGNASNRVHMLKIHDDPEGQKFRADRGKLHVCFLKVPFVHVIVHVKYQNSEIKRDAETESPAIRNPRSLGVVQIASTPSRMLNKRLKSIE